MNRLTKIIPIVILIVILLIFLANHKKEEQLLKQYCSNLGCVYTRYGVEELKDIPIKSNENLSYLKNFNITFIFIDPQLSGNFTVSYLNLIIALNNFAIYSNKSLRTIGVCTKISEGCNYYTNNSLEEYFWLFYNNETYLINGTKVLRIYIIDSTENEIEINKNFIFLKGDKDGIVKVLDKFLLYWYGIINN